MRHSREGGMSLRASINGRTGISSSSDASLSGCGATFILIVCAQSQTSIHQTSILTRWRRYWQDSCSEQPDSPHIHSSPRKDVMALTQTIQQSERWTVRGQRERDAGERAPPCRAYCGCTKTPRALEINQIGVCYRGNSGLIGTGGGGKQNQLGESPEMIGNTVSFRS